MGELARKKRKFMDQPVGKANPFSQEPIPFYHGKDPLAYLGS
jgi:hypothetical protein